MVISIPFKQVIRKGKAANVTKRDAIGSNSGGVVFYEKEKMGAGGEYKKNTSSKEQV